MEKFKVLQGGLSPMNYDRVRVHIKVIFEDDDHGYMELYLVTNTEILLNTIIDCRLTLNQVSSYSDTVYNEVLNLVFRPKVPFNRICSSIMSYIGCNINSDVLVGHVLESPDEPVEIVAHINVESDEYSQLGILPNFDGWKREDPYYKMSNNHGTSLCLPSRIRVLNPMEQLFLFRLGYVLMELPTNSCRWTYGQLWNFFWVQAQEMNYEEVDKNTLSGIIDTLLFYELIDIKQEDIIEGDNNKKEHYFIFSVRDLNLYHEFFNLFDNDCAA